MALFLFVCLFWFCKQDIKLSPNANIVLLVLLLVYFPKLFLLCVFLPFSVSLD